MTARGDLTGGRLSGKVFRFGFPLSLALALHGMFNLVDAIIVGRLGEGAIAAVTISGVIAMIPMLLFEGVSNLTVAYVAQAQRCAVQGQRQTFGHQPAFRARACAACRRCMTGSLSCRLPAFQSFIWRSISVCSRPAVWVSPLSSAQIRYSACASKLA